MLSLILIRNAWPLTRLILRILKCRIRRLFRRSKPFLYPYSSNMTFIFHEPNKCDEAKQCRKVRKCTPVYFIIFTISISYFHGLICQWSAINQFWTDVLFFIFSQRWLSSKFVRTLNRWTRNQIRQTKKDSFSGPSINKRGIPHNQMPHTPNYLFYDFSRCIVFNRIKYYVMSADRR